METEFAIVGGGLVGAAIGYGLARLGKDVTVFDEGDAALRASRGNFGLIWVQGKGAALPDYARWTRTSAALWPTLREELDDDVHLELSQPGGIDVCLSDEEADEKVARLQGLKDALGGDYPFEFLGHNALRELEPAIGPQVTGATFFPEDGHVNPLYTLRALHRAFREKGGRLENGATVERIEPTGLGFRVVAAEAWRARNVVLCAGLGNARLAPMVGLRAPVVPNQGQVLICERMQPFLRHPSVQIRQVGEGAIQIGDSKEDVGLNDTTSPRVVSAIAKRAMRIYPVLKYVRVVRSWAALRIMSPDGHPIYDRSTECPGASVVTCHSGVTLAAAHALVLARWIAGEEQRDDVVDPQLAPVRSLSVSRFDIQTPH